MNMITKILLENTTTFAERNKIFALTEGETSAVDNTMVSNLYKSAVNKAHVDFEDIPESKGDITKYSGYTSMLSVISILKTLSAKSNVKINELDIIETSLSNIVGYRDKFEKGFQLDKEFIILQYNSLVYACVESVSVVIASYVDYIKRPDRVDFGIVKDPKINPGYLCLRNLSAFNESVKQGDFAKVMSAVINAGKQSFVGVDDIIVPTLIIGGVIALVPIIRELIFYFYYSRMRTSDYLKQQAAFLDMNKNNVQSANLPAAKKKEVLKKQQDAAVLLNSLSDKIKVDRINTENKVNTEINTENKNWTLSNIQSQSASTDKNGLSLL